MVNSAEFIKKLENIMEFYGLSATAFAEELDFNRSTISHLLSGRNKPSLDFVVKILQRFPEVSMSWLIFGKGNFPSTSEIIDEQISTTKMDNIKAVIENPSLEKAFEMEIPQAISENTPNKKVKKIVILYSDGSFNIYEN